MKKIFLALTIAGLLASCGNESTEATSETTQKSTTDETKPELTAGINPPAPGVNVPFMKKKMNAQAGGTFVYETGSIVTFPENAVLHADGTPVTGEFDVEYREFHDPIDIFFSGIPMDYDSAGTSYNFISAGMCELKAYQNGEELMVNPSANPSVDMVSKDADPAHNLYYYDEEANEWIPQGKPVINDFKEPEDKPEIGGTLPSKPQKINKDKYSFFISVDELGSEFEGFDNMYFQIADEEKNYNPADAGIQWHSVDVKKSTKLKGKYIVTFANASTSRTYITDPVFSDEEYDKAMATYNKVVAENEAAIKKQEEEMAKWEAKQAMIIAQNRKVDSINEVIAKKNEEIKAYNKMVLEKEKEFEAMKEMTFQEAKFAQNAYSLSRGFAVDGFGVWNCDNPAFSNNEHVLTSVEFTNKNFDEQLDDIFAGFNYSLIYKEFNSVMNFTNNSFKNLLNTDEVIMIVVDETLYYGEVATDATHVNLTLKEMDLSNTSFNEVKNKLMGY